MKIARMIVVLSAVAGLSTGCATHSVMRMSNAVSVKNKPATTYAAHKNKVFVTESVLAGSVQCERLGQIDVGMVTYASKDEVLKRMANKARELGADAVVEVRTWYQPAGWAWRAPQGTGQAIKLTDKSAVDFSKVTGDWH